MEENTQEVRLALTVRVPASTDPETVRRAIDNALGEEPGSGVYWDAWEVGGVELIAMQPEGDSGTQPIDLEALQRLVPEAVFFPGDPDEGCLSVFIAGYTEVTLLQNGEVWFHVSHPNGGTIREERAGTVDPGLAPEEAAVVFRKLVIEAVKKYLPPDEPDHDPSDWANQPGRDPQEGYWHYTPEDFESDSFGPPPDDQEG